jgi:hypothetical protein
MGDRKVIGDQDGVSVTKNTYGFAAELLGLSDYTIRDEDTGKTWIRDSRDDALEKAREIRDGK